MASDLIQLAAKIATDAHRGQTRWDGKTPYISHPAAVARALADQGYSENYVAAAWLHDVIEDTHLTAKDLIDQGIPQDVVTAVELLTKQEDESYINHLLVLSRHRVARTVKHADISHNMSDMNEKQRHGSMYQKYELALYLIENESK